MTRAQTPNRPPDYAPDVQTPHTEPSSASGPIHLVVDLTRCQAYAQCCFLAPSVFRLHGEEALWYDPAPDAAQREQVMRAAVACPVQAIHVEMSAPGRQRERKHTEHGVHEGESHAARHS